MSFISRIRVPLTRSGCRALGTLSGSEKQKLFFSCSQFAVVGASASKEKWGSKIYKWFKLLQVPVTPINPNLKALDGVPCLSSVKDLPSPSETGIVLVTHPSVTLSVLADAGSARIPMVWLQPGAGAAHTAVRAFIRAQGMEDKVIIDSSEAENAPTLGDSSSQSLDTAGTGSGKVLAPPSLRAAAGAPSPVRKATVAAAVASAPSASGLVSSTQVASAALFSNAVSTTATATSTDRGPQTAVGPVCDLSLALHARLPSDPTLSSSTSATGQTQNADISAAPSPIPNETGVIEEFPGLP